MCGLTDIVSASAGGGAPDPGALEHGHLPAARRLVVLVVQTVRTQVTDLQTLAAQTVRRLGVKYDVKW